MAFDEAARFGADIVIISEPNKKFGVEKEWIMDSGGDVAITITKNLVEVEKIGRKKGYV